MVIFMFYDEPLPDIVFQGQLYKVFVGSKELFMFIQLVQEVNHCAK